MRTIFLALLLITLAMPESRSFGMITDGGEVVHPSTPDRCSGTLSDPLLNTLVMVRENAESSKYGRTNIVSLGERKFFQYLPKDPTQSVKNILWTVTPKTAEDAREAYRIIMASRPSEAWRLPTADELTGLLKGSELLRQRTEVVEGDSTWRSIYLAWVVTSYDTINLAVVAAMQHENGTPFHFSIQYMNIMRDLRELTKNDVNRGLAPMLNSPLFSDPQYNDRERIITSVWEKLRGVSGILVLLVN